MVTDVAQQLAANTGYVVAAACWFSGNGMDNPTTPADRSDLPADVGVLVLKSGADPGIRHLLSGPLTTAGRHPRSDIFLDDITVSRRHVEVSRAPAGEYVLRDVGSLNGTYVNRQRIDEITLTDGDEVQIGKFKLVFFTGRPG